MRRIRTGQMDDGTPVCRIEYAPKDRVKVAIDDEVFAGTVFRPADFDQAGWGGSEIYYCVRLDDGREVRIHERAIVKQADTGGYGPVKHLEEF